MSKHNQTKKWALIGLLPSIAGIGWATRRWLRRNKSVPRDRAIVPLDEIPQVAVTGGDRVTQPSVHEQVQENRGGPFNRTETTTKEYAPQRAYEKAQKDQAETSPDLNSGVNVFSTGHAQAKEPSAETASFLVLLIPFIALAIAIAVLAAYRTPVQSSVVVPGGNAQRGQVYLQAWGCGSCHTISGIDGADGKVGPNLSDVGLHSFVAGHLQNSPDNMVQWIMHPQQIAPGNGMPEMGVPENVARDMAAYLYSLNSSQRSPSLNFNRR